MLSLVPVLIVNVGQGANVGQKPLIGQASELIIKHTVTELHPASAYDLGAPSYGPTMGNKSVHLQSKCDLNIITQQIPAEEASLDKLQDNLLFFPWCYQEVCAPLC